MEALDRIGMIPGGWPKTPPEELAAFMAEAAARRGGPPIAAPAPPFVSPAQPSRTLAEVAQAWLAERRQKNPRTVYAKECHYGNFIEHLASTSDMSAFNQGERAAFNKREQNAAREAAEAEGKAFRKITDATLNGTVVATKTAMARSTSSGQWTSRWRCSPRARRRRPSTTSC